MNAYAEALAREAQAADLRNRVGQYPVGATIAVALAIQPGSDAVTAVDAVARVRAAHCPSCYRSADNIRTDGHGRGCYFAEGGAR